MCINWGSVAEWVAAVAAIATAIFAWAALGSWHKQLRGATRHAVAHEVATAARALRYAFYDARSPAIFAYELPPDYSSRPANRALSDAQKADDFLYSCNSRQKELRPYLAQFVTLRPKAGASLGDDVADAIEALGRKASELFGFMGHKIEMLQAGNMIVEQWMDQDYAKRTNEAVTLNTSDRSDAFSLEFEEKLKALMGLLKSHLR